MDLVRAMGLKDISWLDTSCGTGTLAGRVLAEGEDVRFTLCDPEEVEHHINRRGVEVFPITIEEHIRLLRARGFGSFDVLWTSYLQAGFWAIKG